MSQLLRPGEALYVPRFIDPDQAMRLGGFIRPLCVDGVQLDMAYFIGKPNTFISGEAPLTDAAREGLQALHDTVDRALAGPQPKEEYIVATYMNSPVRRFAWHVDPDFDVRPIINIGETETTILLSAASGTFDPEGTVIYLDQTPAEENQISIPLEPGDAYFLDNRVAREHRLPHATPPNAMGRLMLRYNRIYPCWEDEPFDLGQFDGTVSISQLQTAP